MSDHRLHCAATQSTRSAADEAVANTGLAFAQASKCKGSHELCKNTATDSDLVDAMVQTSRTGALEARATSALSTPTMEPTAGKPTPSTMTFGASLGFRGALYNSEVALTERTPELPCGNARARTTRLPADSSSIFASILRAQADMRHGHLKANRGFCLIKV